MSAEVLCTALPHISKWAIEHATWTGLFNETAITISPIHPLKEITATTLRLGTTPIVVSTPQEDIRLQFGTCKCCFDLYTNNNIWCRFQTCTDHKLPKRRIQYLFTKVLPSTGQLSNAEEILYYKGEGSTDLLNQVLKKHNHLNRWRFLHTDGLTELTIPSHVEYLEISHCVRLKSIQGINHTSHLQTAILEWCPNLHNISTLDSVDLQHLRIHWCPKLEVIPTLRLPKLESISIQACQKLKTLPDLSECRDIEEIRFCWFSQHLPLPSFEHCHKLRFLILRSLATMTHLPSVSTIRLEWIDVAESNSLQTIRVEGVRLRTLIADGCGSLEIVDVSKSTNLRRLSLARVSKLQEIHGLVENHSLQDVQISEAPTLSHLDGLETNFELRTLTLVNCPELTHLPNWRRLIQLVQLTIYGCNALRTLPHWTLPSLEEFKLGGCDSMTEMVPFSQFPNLRVLKWSSFKGVETQIEISPLIHLKHLIINGHPTLEEVLGLDSLNHLEIVDFSRCTTLTSIEHISTSTTLRQINLQGCQSLSQLPSLFQLEHLEELSVSHCQTLLRLDCLYYHPHLKLLNISHCPSLHRLPLLHLGTRASIRQLYCTHLPQPIDISKLVGGVIHSRLKEIYLEHTNLISLTPLLSCRDLIEITGLEPTVRWKLLLQVAIRRNDQDWILKHWDQCLQHLRAPHAEDMAATCIEGLKRCASVVVMPMLQQLFAQLRQIEHASTGDSLIPAPIWEQLFEWLHNNNDAIFLLFNPILEEKSIKIDLMREENWFPVLIDVCVKHTLSQRHAQLLEQIYQQALFKSTPMYDHLRSKWLWLIIKGQILT